MTSGIRKAFETVSAALLYSAVVLAPVPLGSLDSHWQAVWCCVLAASLLTAPLDAQGWRRPFLRPALALLICFGVVVWLQTLAPSTLNPAHPAWALAAKALMGSTLPPQTTAVVVAPLDSLMMPFLFAMAFVRTSLHCAAPTRTLQLLRVLRVGILGVGLLSAFAWWLDPTQLLGEPKLYYRRAFTGTFINANTAATYFGFGALLWTARALESGVMAAPRRMSGWQGRVLQITDALTPHAMGAPMAAIACVAMVAMTGSRAGLLITLALGAGMVLAAMNMRQRRGFLYAALAAAGVIGVLVVPSTLFDRLLAGGLWDNYRFEVYRICLVMLRDAPWIGHGAGAFEFVFPAYRTETLGMFGIWDHAHSTPLELAVEMGIPFVALLALVWGAVLAKLGGAVWQHRIVHAPSGGAAIAGLAVAALGTFHSLIDFPLQLAGTLIPFAAIVAIALAGTDAAMQQSAIRLPQSNESSARQMTKDY